MHPCRGGGSRIVSADAEKDSVLNSLNQRIQLWNGHLWNPVWFQEFAPSEIGNGELLSLNAPDRVLQEQEDLLAAGSDAISTNTFGATSSLMAELSAGEMVEDANLAAARIARTAADKFSSNTRARWTIGSMGPTWEAGSATKTDGEVSARLTGEYLVQARALLRGGVSILHVEMCQSTSNARAALSAIRALETEVGHRIPTMVTAAIEATNTMLDGTTIGDFWLGIKDFDPLVFGYSARGDAITETFRNYPKQIGALSAVFAQTFAVGSGDAWIETPASVAKRLTDSAILDKVHIIGLSIAVRPEYVRSLAAELSSMKA